MDGVYAVGAGFSQLELPLKRRGPRTREYYRQREIFAETLLDFDRRSELGRLSARGWGYMLENEGLVDKSQIDLVEALVNECRKEGLIPGDFTREDDKRQWQHVERLDYPSASSEARSIVDTVDDWTERWTPFSFWDEKPVRLQLMVEKIDLVTVFEPVCQKYRVPICNGGGSSDINSRAGGVRRFRRWVESSDDELRLVMLYCGDHDPGGLRIKDSLSKNLNEDLAKLWFRDDPEPLDDLGIEVDHFGLHYEFIVEHDITWIDGLITNSGKDLGDPRHPDHFKPYVQDYLDRFGARKVEANALVTRVQAARDLMEQTIHKYVDADSVSAYEAELEERRAELPDHVIEELRRWIREGGE